MTISSNDWITLLQCPCTLSYASCEEFKNTEVGWKGRRGHTALSMLSLSFLKAETALSSLLITNGLTVSHQNLHFCTNSSMTARCSNSVLTDKPDIITYGCINICQRKTHRNRTVPFPSRCPQPSVTHSPFHLLPLELSVHGTDCKTVYRTSPHLVLLLRVSLSQSCGYGDNLWGTKE